MPVAKKNNLHFKFEEILYNQKQLLFSVNFLWLFYDVIVCIVGNTFSHLANAIKFSQLDPTGEKCRMDFSNCQVEVCFKYNLQTLSALLDTTRSKCKCKGSIS